jgi:hypothetical protein
VVKATLRLSERTFRCDQCDLVLDRDLNAARNLAQLAAEVTGGTSSPSLRGDGKRTRGKPTPDPHPAGSGYRHGKTHTNRCGSTSARQRAGSGHVFTRLLNGVSDHRAATQVAFIFPIYNEASTIDLLHQTVTEVTGALAGRYEFSFIYVDDGSRDQSLETLTALAKEDKRVTVIELSRNFGHQMAVTAGLDLVDADATIIMDSDMQDPPRVALELIEK